MNNRTLLVLKRARGYINIPEHWIKGQFMDMTKDAYCAIGAVKEALCSYNQDNYNNLNLAIDALNAQAKLYGFDNILEYNDSPDTTHEGILNVFDRAIKEFEKFNN
jgi:hypothetical protein